MKNKMFFLIFIEFESIIDYVLYVIEYIHEKRAISVMTMDIKI